MCRRFPFPNLKDQNTFESLFLCLSTNLFFFGWTSTSPSSPLLLLLAYSGATFPPFLFPFRGRGRGTSRTSLFLVFHYSHICGCMFYMVCVPKNQFFVLFFFGCNEDVGRIHQFRKWCLDGTDHVLTLLARNSYLRWVKPKMLTFSPAFTPSSHFLKSVRNAQMKDKYKGGRKDNQYKAKRKTNSKKFSVLKYTRFARMMHG